MEMVHIEALLELQFNAFRFTVHAVTLQKFINTIKILFRIIAQDQTVQIFGSLKHNSLDVCSFARDLLNLWVALQKSSKIGSIRVGLIMIGDALERWKMMLCPIYASVELNWLWNDDSNLMEINFNKKVHEKVGKHSLAIL